MSHLGGRLSRLILASFLAVVSTGKAAPPQTDVANRELANPEPIELYFLHYLLAGTEPPFRDLAKLDPAFRSANEFNRDAALARAEADLRAKAETVKGVKFLEVNLEDAFGEYDSKYKEFDFTIGNGSRISFGAFGRQINLVLTNGGLAQSWQLDPAEAQDVLRRTAGDRKVVLVLKLELIGAPPAASGTTLLSINTRILQYEIRSRRNVRLGNIVVK